MPNVRCRIYKSGRKAVSDLIRSTIDRLRVEVPEAEDIAHMTHVWNAVSSEICRLDYDDEVPCCGGVAGPRSWDSAGGFDPKSSQRAGMSACQAV